ncbi:emp24/gp25L/p24 family/GOLD-domain-containing protein [Spinellus fusiger]|nr:emp24/gp25L/p24 family/GOLD-domain-containing protein [Spinellus fusiger]
MTYAKAIVFILSVLASLAVLPLSTQATALTYNLLAHETACFYTWTDVPEKKIGFYFAVQRGGNFDIDVHVKDPQGKTIIQADHENLSDYVFTAIHTGEYEFCFSNAMSTFTDKLFDFEITVEHEARPTTKTTGNELTEKTSVLEDSASRVGYFLTEISRNQKYLRTREHRSANTVISTESRMYWSTLIESVAIIGMACLQVVVIKGFFSTKKGGV